MEKKETLGKEKREEFGAVNSGPHFENACRGRKHLLQSQTPPPSSTGYVFIFHISHFPPIIPLPSLLHRLPQTPFKFLVNLVPKITMYNCCTSYILSLSFSLWHILNTNQSPPFITYYHTLSISIPSLLHHSLYIYTTKPFLPSQFSSFSSTLFSFQSPLASSSSFFSLCFLLNFSTLILCFLHLNHYRWW